MTPKDFIHSCFALAILVGLGLILLGPVLKHTRPYFMLDVVLSPEQLKDVALRERTLAQLKQDERLDWTLPSIAGLMLIAVGGVGRSVGQRWKQQFRST